MRIDIDIENQIKNLWIKTFGDPQEYVDMIFDGLCNDKTVQYEMIDDKVVAAMMAIPYEFKYQHQTLRGLYLCGLMTDNQYRNQGMMTRLIEKINRFSKHEEYDFTFLIPSSPGLIKYYQDRGYVSGIYNYKEHYTDVHNFYKELISSKEHKDDVADYERCRISILDFDNRDDCRHLANWMIKAESSFPDFNLVHSCVDWQLIFSDARIYGNKILVAYDAENEICGAAFTDEFDGRLRVKYITAVNRGVYYHLLQSAIDRVADGRAMTVVKSVLDNPYRALWSPVYGAADPDAPLVPVFGIAEEAISEKSLSDVYGMVRLTNPHHVLEILGNCTEELKYGNVTEYSEENEFTITTSDGSKYLVTDAEECKNNAKCADLLKKGYVLISLRELSEIIFRRPSSAEVVDEALGLPRLPLSMALLLD